jgi:hypothetical protein
MGSSYTVDVVRTSISSPWITGEVQAGCLIHFTYHIEALGFEGRISISVGEADSALSVPSRLSRILERSSRLSCGGGVSYGSHATCISWHARNVISGTGFEQARVQCLAHAFSYRRLVPMHMAVYSQRGSRYLQGGLVE